MKTDQIGMSLGDEKRMGEEWLQLEKIITDRGSKYSVTLARITSNAELKAAIKRVKKNKKYAKASHNSYAARVLHQGRIFDVKGDDGETGAGMVILRQLQKANAVDVVVIVTRWFGGVMLHADRFKHVQDATIMGLKAAL